MTEVQETEELELPVLTSRIRGRQAYFKPLKEPIPPSVRSNAGCVIEDLKKAIRFFELHPEFKSAELVAISKEEKLTKSSLCLTAWTNGLKKLNKNDTFKIAQRSLPDGTIRGYLGRR